MQAFAPRQPQERAQPERFEPRLDEHRRVGHFAPTDVLRGIEVEVHPDYRGRGIGSELIQYAEQLARRVGRNSIGLSSWDLPKAAAFAEQEADPPAHVALVVTAGPFQVRGTGDAAALVPVHRFTAGMANGPELHVFNAPGAPEGAVPDMLQMNPTHEGVPLVVSVIGTSPDAYRKRRERERRPARAAVRERKTGAGGELE